MASDHSESRLLSFRCGFCGFVYTEVEEAEQCELRCVSRALARLEVREARDFRVA
jgi:hypothetical protein